MMKNCAVTIILSTLLLAACQPTTTSTPVTSSPTKIPTAIQSPTSTPLPQGNTIIVKSTSDSGPGTLRQALQDARAYDTIEFDPDIFDPDEPATIYVEADPLLGINPEQHHLTLDGSGAGVILDGSHLSRNWMAGLQIVGSSGVTIRGLQVSHFPGPAISISEESHYNLIEGNRLTENTEGIDLITRNTSNNTITNNLIGIGVGDVPAGNYKKGIAIYEGAHDNTVGPDNQIAYNGPEVLANMNDGCGIDIENSEEHPASFGNMLTTNSIHDNKGDGICLVDHATQDREASNGNIGAPYILSIDVTAGYVSGISCPDCTIEIFSTQDGEEGQLFEGYTQAGNDGTFTFQKTDPGRQNTRFVYDDLVVTATDADNNTSEFSRAGGLFHISENWEILQAENANQAFLLLTKPSQLLPDNHISAWLDAIKDYKNTDIIFRTGFKRIHIASLTGSNQGQWTTIINSETLTQEVDDIISEYAENGVVVVLMLAASGSGLPGYGYNFQPGSGDFENQYLPYITFVAQHFKGRIPYYEIWNEPVNINPMDYLTLVRQAVPVIRGIDPEAKITIGSIHGFWEFDFPGYGEYGRNTADIGYLNYILRSDLRNPKVDGISWHPYIDTIPGDPYYQAYPQIVQGIKEMAVSQGFTGEYFGDDMLWSIQGEVRALNGPPVSMPIAAKYYIRAITDHRGLGVNVTINPFFQKPFLDPIANICTILAGAEPSPVALSIESTAANVRQYAFVLPNGDRLVAVWTNDDAVEEDPGVKANLTFPGSSAQSVTGIDVFNGFEQELVTETGNGNLVINDLRLKDYPIFLRFTGAHLTETTETLPEPVTIKLRQNAEERVPAGTPIQFASSWLADSQEQVTDFMAAASLNGMMYGILDGQPLLDLNGHWGEIGPHQGGSGYISQWLYPLGVLRPGTYTVEIWCTLDQPVTDGFDSNHDGQLDMYSGEIWQISMQIEVY